ncbi:MAG: hypothetical protein H7068_11470 [Pedobacter sp.]|nr:hypothetical protein [Chitinophagaceae bacterium]
MENTFKEKAELLTEHIGDFLETKKDLALINASIISTNIVSSLVVFLLIALFTLVFILFAATALALWLGNIFQNLSLGFVVTGLIFLIIGLICFMLKKTITVPIKNLIIKLFYDKD